ncbi:PEP_CTERM-anchored TLD domain-containing protein [Massilia timonae]|uniref:PEP_CTERM-anchored TLD domain-containing protein n=1 Tax=Massilia timonae TaxID=47229 RepID=UPI000ED69A5A|nr:PEP_CTERM-anchored TLD domain-containing protein [Massilia timonae]HAK90480.1 PEP-CTERM sorting domain-containing protein [Massilia timonae]
MNKILARGGAAAILVAATGIAASPAVAQDEPPLLDPSLQGQLERWLGAGPLYLDNIYTRQPGDDSLDFHAAADGRGSNFTLMRVANDAGDSWVVGGYNPRSWSSTAGWHVSERDWQRTAFLFNYTDPAVYRQLLLDNVLPSQGSRQTYNWPDHGPTFGAGPDLFVDDRLTTSISWQLSYGDPAFEGRSIIDGTYGGQFRRVEALETYAISLVPEPPAYALLVGGLGMIGWAVRRRRR